MRVHAASTRHLAFVDVQAELLAVALVARLALAEEVGRQVAALRVLDATGRDRRICALVNVCVGIEEKRKFGYQSFCGRPSCENALARSPQLLPVSRSPLAGHLE